MATTKYIVYYRVRAIGAINRQYPEYDSSLDHATVQADWQRLNASRIYVDHEPHDNYTAAFQAANMVGADEATVRTWLEQRVAWLRQQRAAQQQAKAAAMIPAPNSGGYGGLKPGDMTRDQHGRSGRVPHVPVEVFRDKPIDPEAAHRAIQDMCKGR